MGSNSSKEAKEYSQDGLKRFAQNFEYLKSEEDPRFGREIKVFKERSSKKLIAMFNKATEDGNFTEKMRNEMRMRLGMSHKNLAKIVGFTRSEDETLCGSSHQLAVYNEYYESDLDLEIKDRKPQKEYFQESEIWYLANSTISLGSYLQDFGIYHGDIRPLNMLMDESGSVYFVDHGVVNPHKDNLSKAFSGDKTVFLSPRELEILKTKSETATYDVFRSDVFSAGLSLLYACHLENPIYLYNFENHSFDSAGLQQAIKQVEQNYSKPLADLITWMTEEDDLKRPDFSSLNTTLKNQGRAISEGKEEPVNHTLSTPAKNARGIVSPTNIHYGNSPSLNSSGKKDNSLQNSQISALGGTTNPGFGHNLNASPMSYNVSQANQQSPFKAAGHPNIDPQGSVRMGTLYSYPAHYYK